MRAQVIVVGNAKGGSGKSTTALHVAVRLMHQGSRVAVLDLDDRQRTLTRTLENRARFMASADVALPMPTAEVLPGSTTDFVDAAARRRAYDVWCASLGELVASHDAVVVDCPGSDTFLSRVAHGCADTLLTPLNDSFIDLDLLARICPDSHRIEAPSQYSDMVFEQRKKRFLADGRRIDWVVVRNRLAATGARNKRHMGKTLDDLSRRIGFRLAQGLSERVIFRELFLKGITLSDVRAQPTGVALTMNHIAAHQEVKALTRAVATSHLS